LSLRARLPLVAVAALTACSGTSESPPQDSFYRLEVAAPSSAARAPFSGTLVVRRFSADGTVSQRPLVYGMAESGHELHQYNYHFWADPPPRMMQELTVDILRAAQVAEMVVTPEVRVEADFELTGKIRQLDHLRGEQSSVVVGLEFGVYRMRDGEMVLLRDYVVERAASDRTVTEATRAMNAALGEIYARLVQDLAAP
jgi:cholesterol transport system auxiliary component